LNDTNGKYGKLVSTFIRLED